MAVGRVVSRLSFRNRLSNSVRVPISGGSAVNWLPLRIRDCSQIRLPRWVGKEIKPFPAKSKVVDLLAHASAINLAVSSWSVSKTPCA